MPRELLPSRRYSESFTVTFQGERYDVTIGHYDDERVGEAFINRILGKNSAKVGTLLDDVCRDSAILMSLAIQYGADLRTIFRAITRDEEGNPSTIVGAIIDQLMNESTPNDRNNNNPKPSESNYYPADNDKPHDTRIEAALDLVPPTPECSPSRRERRGKDLIHSDPN